MKKPSLKEVFQVSEGDVVKGPWQSNVAASQARPPPPAAPAPKAKGDGAFEVEMREAMAKLPNTNGVIHPDNFKGFAKDVDAFADACFEEAGPDSDRIGGPMLKKFHDMFSKFEAFLIAMDEFNDLAESEREALKGGGKP